MAFRDHKWKIRYKTSSNPPDDILHDFYIPVLSLTKRYDRVAGYFSSSSLAVASQGFSALAQGGGKARFIVGNDIPEDDVQAILDGQTGVLEASLLEKLSTPESWSAPERRGVELLAYMVNEGSLDIKVGVRVHAETGKPLPFDSLADGYVHEKWCLFEDEHGELIHIAGSLNESQTALQLNAENIEVHCAWKNDENLERSEESQSDFETLWENKHPSFKILDIPQAVKEELIKYRSASDRLKELDGTTTNPPENKPSDRDWWTFQFIKDAPLMTNGEYIGIETAPIEPWPHQRIVAKRLVDSYPYSWMLCDEVGLGKTIETGLSLRSLVLSKKVARVLIAAPASVATQWQREMAEKFMMGFARPQTLGGLHHQYLHPREDKVKGKGLFEPPLNIISTGLLAREERQKEISNASPWDVVLLDEAHYARRSNVGLWEERDPEWNRLYRTISQRVRPQTKSFWAATATPMQLETVEAIDLAKLTNRLGPFQEEQGISISFYEVLSKLRRDPSSLDQLEWRFLGRLVHHVKVFDPHVWKFIENTHLKASDAGGLEYWLDSIGGGAEEPSPFDLQAVCRLIFAIAPLSRVMMRHNRGLLRKYKEHGKLKGNLAERRVHLPTLELSQDEKKLYDQFEPYCEGLAEQVKTHSQQRVAVGFMLSFFRLRFASSFKAIFQTLGRRLEKVEETISGKISYQDIDPDAIEAAVIDDDDDDQGELPTQAGLENRDLVDLQWEREQLVSIKNSLSSIIHAPSPKVRLLLKVIEQRRLASDRVNQLVVFTRFYDTLQDIQAHLKPLGLRLGVFAGPKCSYTDPITKVEKGCSRDDVKKKFVNEEIDILLCTDAAAEGLNLQTANMLINFDLPWNPMKVEQRIGRIDRIGQKYDEIDVLNFAYPGTAEEDVYQRIYARIKNANDTVGAQQTVVLPIYPSDLQRLTSGEITKKELDELVDKRIQQAQERAQATELSPDELYEIYEHLDQQYSQISLPLNLEQVESALQQSDFLKEIGAKWVKTPLGDGIHLPSIAGIQGMSDIFGIKECVLTCSRKLYEKGHPDILVPIHFATYGDEVFDRLIEFIESSRPELQDQASSTHGVVKYEVGGHQVSTLDDFLQSTGASAGAPEVSRISQNNPQRTDENNLYEKTALQSGHAHLATHYLCAHNILKAVTKESDTLNSLNSKLPDLSRDLRSGKLPTEIATREARFGLLEMSDTGACLPIFYQQALIRTIKKEKTKLKKSRRGVKEEDIGLSLLLERLESNANEESIAFVNIERGNQ